MRLPLSLQLLALLSSGRLVDRRSVVGEVGENSLSLSLSTYVCLMDCLIIIYAFDFSAFGGFKHQSGV